MKNNIKLFFASLISNNACIDGARKKPWYAAVILFFISLILSVIPSTVLQLNKQGDKNFDSTTYSCNQAFYVLSERLQKEEYKDRMYVLKQGKQSTLVGYDGFIETTNVAGNKFTFIGCTNEAASANISVLKGAEEKTSFVIFTSDTVHISILDPNSDNRVVELTCINAYKKIGENELKNSLVVGDNKTDSANKTWSNWRTIIRKLYNQTRMRLAGTQLAIMSAVNTGIMLIMGFLLWVLTRGKNNPYRLFSVWECFKTAFWAALTPSILTCGFGFLIKSFASMMFPLLIGVRVMWLSMKSLRPDGSGYAAN